MGSNLGTESPFPKSIVSTASNQNAPLALDDTLSSLVDSLTDLLMKIQSMINDRSQKTQLTDGFVDVAVKSCNVIPSKADNALVVTQRDPLTVTAMQGLLPWAVTLMDNLSRTLATVKQLDSGTLLSTDDLARRSAELSVLRGIQGDVDLMMLREVGGNYGCEIR